ncbi:Protein of unknown function DUF2800 [uncultured Caudovirales phage]|uniref:DUF2800 domain-containing protein n=1 Tax=uncultured Caudovirales phage TaxID=2100421 RepID=A0A6J5NQY2_9CAUD|nr:Protein of unknown function DUF2800 [uncultured Caudovirales phage]CAB4161273.1 Protein of unknown function DUF2800 [uncultured Caudovirales phage]CAB4187154.1 Protein of unknown function DUF2800 [uncultured Caudovirales phage]
MKHSTVVGGSTAKRVMNCPGSVALVQLAPPSPSSVYADKGTLLHTVISDVLAEDKAPEDMIGLQYEGQTLDQAMIDEKIDPALDLLDQLDSHQEMKLAVETRVGFGSYLPGAFGSCDVLGRLGDTAYVIDWKFGDGVVVTAEENEQLMFYAAAAMRTPETAWVFDGATSIECIIIQPPSIRRWTTTPKRIGQFARQLKKAVKIASLPDAALKAGSHCRFCPAKPTCPQMTGAVDRALKVKLDAIDNDMLGAYASNAVLLQGWIDDLNALVEKKLKAGDKIVGWKLVSKQSRRKWSDEGEVVHWLDGKGLEAREIYSTEIRSPAQMEKVLKKRKLALPDELVVSVSSGDTLAPESDPRPAVLQIGQQLTAALNKLN